MKPRYYVYTWDIEKEDFTPQKGVRCGPYSLFGLRRALRALQSLGYEADYYGRRDGFGAGDPSVSVQRVDR